MLVLVMLMGRRVWGRVDAAEKRPIGTNHRDDVVLHLIHHPIGRAGGGTAGKAAEKCVLLRSGYDATIDHGLYHIVRCECDQCGCRGRCRRRCGSDGILTEQKV